MKKITINKVTEDTIKNLTENYTNLSTDGIVFINKEKSGESFVSVEEYGTIVITEPQNKIEKINQFIYEGIIHNIVNLTHLGYKAVNDCGDFFEVLAVEDVDINSSLFSAIKNCIKAPGTTQQYKNYFVYMEDFDDDGIEVVRINDNYTFNYIDVSQYQLTEDYIKNVM